MEESWRSIRFIHRLIILISSILFIFALSKDPQVEVKKVLNEIEYISSNKDYKEYGKYLIEQCGSLKNSSSADL